MWKRRLGCVAGRQEVGRCRTRGESQGTCKVTCTPLLSSNEAEPTLALKPRGDVIRSPKKIFKKKKENSLCFAPLFPNSQSVQTMKDGQTD